ncbi:iron transporter [Streptomyces sp. NBC_01294]|uniref:iron transporter n=1 Tax=Streptomyces sp. NBC_01294 TaxID=2903815 RepID=UPI002DDBA0FA|nr:iron transporter [Streptomyces sp. NBC_01294]WRZ60799.1 iron transporter [Streptomyces sp. NBC_01294]
MPRATLRSLLLAVPLALALTACGTADADKAGEAKPQAKETAPAGGAHQHTVLEAEIAANGGETKVGEYRVGYIVEAAEPWFQAEQDGQGGHAGHGKLVNREPAKDETHHIEIIPMEAATGRIVPDVPIRLEVVDAQGQVVQAQDLNFYHAEFFHYANNFSIPTAGKYTLRATLQPPAFLRHGASGETPALSEPVTATFTNVELKPES